MGSEWSEGVLGMPLFGKQRKGRAEVGRGGAEGSPSRRSQPGPGRCASRWPDSRWPDSLEGSRGSLLKPTRQKLPEEQLV